MKTLCFVLINSVISNLTEPPAKHVDLLLQNKQKLFDEGSMCTQVRRKQQQFVPPSLLYNGELQNFEDTFSACWVILVFPPSTELQDL